MQNLKLGFQVGLTKCVRIKEWQLSIKLIGFNMEFTEEVRKATEPIYQKISKVLPEIEWSIHAPYVHRINQLKKKKKRSNSSS